MARIIYKWRYFSKAIQNKRYLKYIATREGVEKYDEAWRKENTSERQKRLIKNLLKDFPELKSSEEYEKMISNQTKGSANDFINYAFDNIVEKCNDKKVYLEYIANRPRVEKIGSHGLFDRSGFGVDLKRVTDEIEQHEGLVFTNIISLTRDDAEETGFNCAKRWQELLSKHEKDIANAMSIEKCDLKWYAAFHNEGHHPHIHLVTYSIGKDEPYMTKAQLEKFKSKLGNDIFKDELYSVYQNKDQRRKEIKKSAEKEMQSLIDKLSEGLFTNANIENLVVELENSLKTYKGKKVYGYLPPRVKNLINGIVDELSKVDEIKKLYDLWYEQKELTIQIYRDKMPNRLPLSANNEFKSIKNIVIREALKLNLSDESNDKTVKNNLGKHNNYYSNQSTAQLTFNLITHIAQIFGNSMDLDYENQDVVESKLHEKTIEKKMAQGLKMG